jgi:hypothetical protein
VLVVVGGPSRKAGKTSVIASIIRSIPEGRWIAVKFTPHAHHASESGDTTRFLSAGARQSHLLAWPDGLDAFRNLVASGANLIVESNRIVEFVQPDLCLYAADFSRAEPKPSAQALLERADALVVTGGDAPAGAARWFRAPPPEYSSPGLIAFVRERMRTLE